MKAIAMPAAAALAFAVAALGPTAAAAATTAATAAGVNMRAGPSTTYPVVARLPARAPLALHGCDSNVSWCDVSWDGERGWISATYVRVAYRGDVTAISPSVAPLVGVAVVGFSHAYWHAHYADRPWYGHWGRHHHHVRPHHPHRVSAVGGCSRGICRGAVAGPRRVAVGRCGRRHCAGTVIRRPHAGARSVSGVIRRR